MRLSTKSTYGLRAMLNIALGTEKSATSIADISKKEGISIAYLEQLLNRLRRRGLVRSVRGSRGGYLLSKGADRITVGDIVKALEGISPVYCVTTKRDLYKVCKRYRTCAPKGVWLKLAKAISDCLESITLEDLCVEAGKVSGLKKGKERSVRCL